jgi:ornithine cyclodeaminase/alanine dehydrogenase-like protein (mu-crystallin family)
MVLLLDQKDVASLVTGPDLMRRIVDVIEASFLDVAKWDEPRDPMVFPTDLSVPKMYNIMGPAPSLNVIGGAMHLRGGKAGQAAHGSYKLVFDLKSGDLLCLLEDGPVHRYMHGADIGVATRWLARDDAVSLGVVTSGAPKVGASPAMLSAATRAAIVTNASIEAIFAVRPIETVRIYSNEPDHSRQLADATRDRFGVDVDVVSEMRGAVTGLDIVSLSTNNAYLDGSDSGVSQGWLSPGTHVNALIRGEVVASVVQRCRLFPASVRDMYAIEPSWEPWASLARAGEVDMPAGLDEVVAKTKPGRISPQDITMFTGASLGAQHADLANWVYQMALEQGVGTRWEQRTP